MRTHRNFLIAGFSLILGPAASSTTVQQATGAVTAPARDRAPGVSARDRVLFDFDWRFQSGEVPGGQSVGLDDAAWDRVDLPHDFMISGKGQRMALSASAVARADSAKLPTAAEGPFDPRSAGGASMGYLNAGIGWYRKAFTMPARAAGRRVVVEFEGAYMNSEVWLNGEKLGTRPYGYSSFQFDLTPQLKFGGAPNVMAVRVQVKQPSSRWYSGAGIYRHVWLTTSDPVHIERW
ncbi:MAG: beta galactosidase jelly roll domain-containing protein, partial [Gemmatimonadetes bacterium]|nr:beta galactosidase jelly roll domain-containing protein [Gemmatimonadota bacterium]